MPEQIEFVSTKKGEIIEASEKESLESALISAHINKKDRIKMLTEMNMEAEEEIPESLTPKPLVVDDNIENEFMTRVNNLQNTMDELKKGIDSINERLDTFENIVSSIRNLALEKLQNRMGDRKLLPVNLPDMSSNDYLKAAVKKYLSCHIGNSVDKIEMIGNIGAQYTDSINLAIASMTELSALYKYNESEIYYIPDDFEERYKNYVLGTKNKTIVPNINKEIKQ